MGHKPPVAQSNTALLDHLVDVKLKGGQQDVVQGFWAALTSQTGQGWTGHKGAGQWVLLWDENTGAGSLGMIPVIQSSFCSNKAASSPSKILQRDSR